MFKNVKSLFRISILLLILANFFDLTMTVYGLQNNIAGELNPILNVVYERYGIGFMVIVKLLIVFLTVAVAQFAFNLSRRRSKPKKTAFLIALPVSGAFLFFLAGLSWLFI